MLNVSDDAVGSSDQSDPVHDEKNVRLGRTQKPNAAQEHYNNPSVEQEEVAMDMNKRSDPRVKYYK